MRCVGGAGRYPVSGRCDVERRVGPSSVVLNVYSRGVGGVFPPPRRGNSSWSFMASQLWGQRALPLAGRHVGPITQADVVPLHPVEGDAGVGGGQGGVRGAVTELLTVGDPLRVCSDRNMKVSE